MQPFGRQVPDARDEQITKQRRGGEHKIGEAPSIGILFFDPLSGRIHQQSIQYIWSLIHRCGNELGSEGTVLVGHMGAGFQAWLIAVFRVDQVHRLALPRGGKELPVTGSSFTGTPVLCHR